MKRRNENGFIHIIVYLLIFIIFAVTVCACLEILSLIELPEKYSIKGWISKHLENVIIEEYEASDGSGTKNIKIQIETDNDKSNSSITMPQVNSYQKSTAGEIIQNTENFAYYDQLDDYGKIIYSELSRNLENMKSGTYNVQFGMTFNDLLQEENGEEILNNSFQLAVNALNFDNPETFFIDIPRLYLLTEVTTKLWVTTYVVEIGCRDGENYLNPTLGSEARVNEAIQNVRNERAKIKASLGESTEEKIKGVHDYLIDNLEYDSTVSKDNIYNIYGALVNKSTVCEGYARSFKYIMDDLGIPCLIACGEGVNSNNEIESHAWNYVNLDGAWYAMDVTWDDPVIIGQGYVSKNINYKYYLKGSNEFFANHTENGDIVGDSNFKYPTLSEENY